ncbi:MAG: prepilin-type N-terminal cleavage/methylation domain-containing protein [Sulfurovum sp.]
MRLITRNRKAFTLLELLITIGISGIIIVALFSIVDIMQDSNNHILEYLKKAKQISKSTKVLYLDILGSDGNITIKKDDFSRICMESTTNSLYSLSMAKVCWIVLKEKNQLARVEGNSYSLPLKMEEKVEVDTIMSDIILFDVYHQKGKVLVLLQQKDHEPVTFMIQGVYKPLPKKKVKKVKNNKRKNRRNPPIPPSKSEVAK